MLVAFISSLLFDIQPATLAIPSIAKGTMYMNPLRTALGRYPVMIELKPGLYNTPIIKKKYTLVKKHSITQKERDKYRRCRSRGPRPSLEDAQASYKNPKQNYMLH